MRRTKLQQQKMDRSATRRCCPNRGDDADDGGGARAAFWVAAPQAEAVEPP